jgi:hypothetical protein
MNIPKITLALIGEFTLLDQQGERGCARNVGEAVAGSVGDGELGEGRRSAREE